MKIITAIFAALLLSVMPATSATPKTNKVHYGVNYTLPFAHAYRAVQHVGEDHRKAIDDDVYHMARMGMNAFRLHLWDTELTDSIGNLLANDHLDLLDYLIAQLEARGIDVILTAQTNFGNGYPEPNTDDYGAYSYRYDKCKVHDDKQAQDAQERYLRQLVKHTNPYTGKTYADDPSIIAMEINNEPCHSGNEAEITSYINRMAKAMRAEGWKKDVLYNVSHNLDRTQAFYNAKIDGTTYQWYPMGLVSGHTRKGNFLPYVEHYEIPFKNLKNYDKKWRAVYEYDPADNLYSYLHTAATRTFRKEGFDWITQFAYDPLSIAAYNSEYPTHYLNLAYTPRKALGMMVAAEVARQTPSGADYGTYPADTIFGPFTVSGRRDLAMCNDGKRYYYTNSNDVAPVDIAKLEQIAGWGTSPIVDYDGTGAYFIDKLADGVWRVEIMPDVLTVADPFGKTNLTEKVALINYAPHNMNIKLPGVSANSHVRQIKGIDKNNPGEMAWPGVYIIGDDASVVDGIDAASYYGNGKKRVDEYVLPKADLAEGFAMRHQAPKAAYKLDGVLINTEILGKVDSAFVVPAYVSMWRSDNPSYRLERQGTSLQYNTVVPQWRRAHSYNRSKNQRPPKPVGENFGDTFDYYIAVYSDGECTTFPGAVKGHPVDWSFKPEGCYSTRMLDEDSQLVLIEAKTDLDGSEIATIPSQWSGISYSYMPAQYPAKAVNRVYAAANENQPLLVVNKYIADMPTFDERQSRLNIELADVQGIDSIKIALVNGDGFAYEATLPAAKGVMSVDIDKLQLGATPLVIDSYPAFMSRWLEPDPATATPLVLGDVQSVLLMVQPSQGREAIADIVAVWID